MTKHDSRDAAQDPIRVGQVYRACHAETTYGLVREIEVLRLSRPTCALRVWVAELGTGKWARWVGADQLHPSSITQTGELRRTGYYLVEGRSGHGPV
jgi:hypothetical protein